MKFAVVWKPGAEQDLAAIWLASSDRNAIGAAVTEIDNALQASPMHFGESRESGTRRIGFSAPLGVQYEVLPDVGVSMCLLFGTRRAAKSELPE